MDWIIVLAAWSIVVGIRAEARLLGPYWSWLELATWHWPDHAPYRRRRRNALVRRFAVAGLVGFILLYTQERATLLDAIGAGLLGGSILVWPALSDPGYEMVRGPRRWLLYGVFVLFVCIGSGVGGWIATEALLRGGLWAFAKAQTMDLIVGFVVGTFAVAGLDRLSTGGQIEHDVDANPRPTVLPRPLQRQLKRSAGSGTVWRWARSVTDETDDWREQRALVQLLIAETEARRAWHRLGEWIAVALERTAGSAAARTLGPFQMSNAPWSRREAVQMALNRLRACNIDLSDQAALARCWHGAASRQPGEAVSYLDVLEYCRPLAKEIIDTFRPDRP